MQQCADSNAEWVLWLESIRDQTGASMSRWAKEYRDLLAGEELLKKDGVEDGRRTRGRDARALTGRKEGYSHKALLSAMLNGKRCCGPVVAWRLGAAAARLSSQPLSSGLESLLAAGHRADVIGLVGSIFERWSRDSWAELTDAATLQCGLALISARAVELPVPREAEAQVYAPRDYQDALQNAWRRWLSNRDVSLLPPRYRMAYIALTEIPGAHGVDLAQVVLTDNEYNFGLGGWGTNAEGRPTFTYPDFPDYSAEIQRRRRRNFDLKDPQEVIQMRIYGPGDIRSLRSDAFVTEKSDQ